MVIYPFSAPIILTDSIYTLYGGSTGSSTAAQRQAAYLIAEKQATKYIGTPLLPINVTGTYQYLNQPRIVTDYGYVHAINDVQIISQNVFSFQCQLTQSAGCAFIANDTYGYLDVQILLPTATLISYYSIPYPAFPPVMPFLQNYNQPYNFQVSYNCGLPTGTATQADMLLALTLAAQINLNLMIDQAALAGEADIGIEMFTTLDYTERRHKAAVKRTVFGSSAMAMKVAGLIDGAVVKCRPQLQL